MQTVWKGVISFGLVSIPVQLFAATEEHGVSFRQIHASDGGQIRYRRVCTLDGEEVPYEDIVRGYELPDGRVVVLTDEDFAGLPLASSRAIEVLGFADADTVDPVRLSRSYYCEPTGTGANAYVLLRDALQRTGKVALVKVALRTRETPAVLHPRDGVLVLHLLLWADEVRKPRFRFLHDEITPRPRELQAAEAYIHTLAGTLDADEMVDRYQAALKELVEAKVAGRQLEQPPAAVPADGADNLMEALRRSVEKAKQDRGPAAAPAAGPARKRAAKQASTTRAATESTASRQPTAARKATASPQPAPARKTTASPQPAPARKATASPQPAPARKATATKRSPARKTAAKKSTKGG